MQRPGDESHGIIEEVKKTRPQNEKQGEDGSRYTPVLLFHELNHLRVI